MKIIKYVNIDDYDNNIIINNYIDDYYYDIYNMKIITRYINYKAFGIKIRLYF